MSIAYIVQNIKPLTLILCVITIATLWIYGVCMPKNEVEVGEFYYGKKREEIEYFSSVNGGYFYAPWCSGGSRIALKNKVILDFTSIDSTKKVYPNNCISY